MPRAPDWTEQEFETLLAPPPHPHLSDTALAPLLPTRTTDAIAVVREGIHAFHTGGALTLSKMMQHRLADPARPARCPRCGGAA